MEKEIKTEIIYGRHPIMDALENGIVMEKILLATGTHGDFEKRIRFLSKERQIPLQIVPKEKLNSITKKNHQGVIAFTSPIEYFQIEDLLPLIYEKGEIPLFVLLDGVTDVRNLGAIARSAEAFGVHALVIPKKGSAQINEEAIKTSAGALNYLTVSRVQSLVTTVEYFAQNGIQVVAADVKGEKQLKEISFDTPTAIILGDESRAVNRSLLELVDETYRIPIVGQVDSYNVSVAAGITLYEVNRQRFS